MKYSKYREWQESDLEAAVQRMGKRTQVRGGIRAGEPKGERTVAVDSLYKSAPSPQKREYDSKWEETYAAELVLRKHAGLIKAFWYHPFSMWLPGKVRYTPDFMIEYPDGLEQRMEIIDVKGWHKNLRAAMVAIRVGAGVFPCFTWKLVKKVKGGGWEEELVEA